MLRHSLLWCSAFAAIVSSGIARQSCKFVILMVDHHALDDIPYLDRGVDRYNLKSAVVNYLYAKRHGYDFHYAAALRDTPSRSQNWRKYWFKLWAITHLLYRPKAPPAACQWGLYLDSDALFLNHEAPLDELLANISHQFRRYDWSLDEAAVIIERESGRLSNTMINTGVILFNFNRAKDLILYWAMPSFVNSSNACPGPTCAPCKPHKWPYDQGCLEMLFRTHLARDRRPGLHLLASDHVIGLVPPGTMNGPFGKFVRHVWRGHYGLHMQQTIFSDTLWRLGVTSVDRFNELLREMRKQNFHYMT